MPAHVVLTLDTTAPALSLSATQDPGDPTLVTLGLASDPDVAEMKVWGAIDDTDPANASYGTTEGAADWIPFDPAPLVRAHPNGGNLLVRVRDDVHNQSAARAVEINTGAGPPPPPTPAPATVPGWPGAPTPRRRPEAKTVVTRSTLLVRTRGTTTTSRSTTSTLRVRSRAQIGHVARNSSRAIIRTRGHHEVAVGFRSEVRISTDLATTKRAEGPKTEQALLDLDIL